MEVEVDKNSSFVSNKSYFKDIDNLNETKTSDKINSSVSNDFRL